MKQNEVKKSDSVFLNGKYYWIQISILLQVRSNVNWLADITAWCRGRCICLRVQTKHSDENQMNVEVNKQIELNWLRAEIGYWKLYGLVDGNRELPCEQMVGTGNRLAYEEIKLSVHNRVHMVPNWRSSSIKVPCVFL